MTIFFPGGGDSASTIANLRALADDLERMTMFRPNGELEDAPTLNGWTTILRPVGGLTGFVEGHPLHGSRHVVTSEVFAMDTERGWARTFFPLLPSRRRRRAHQGFQPMSDDYQQTIDMILEAAAYGELNTVMKDLHMKTRPLAADALVDLAVARAISGELRDQLRAGGTRALVVEVPDGGWAEPVGDAIKAMIGDLAYVISRASIPRGHELNDGMLPKKLRDGRVAVGVAAQPDRTLPPLLLSLAELRVTIAAPDAAMIVEVIRKAQGGRIPKDATSLRPELLSFDEITALIDRNGNAAETVKRIRAAIERKTGTNGSRKDSKPLPKLEEAIEYGAAREWALSLRDDIRDMRKGLIGWDDIDRGCVLHGPPGTGKTLLARMLGEACGVPVVVSSIAELFANSSGYLNDVIKALRKTFDEARAKAPSILFLDEINALPNIDQVGERNKDYWAPVIFDFYTLLDGAMSGRDGVIVIGATNRIEDIHPALLRPGRLERAIHVGAPDAAGVERIMRHHLGGDLADVDLGKLAIQNVGRGATGAVVMEQVRAARRLARRAGRPMVMADLESQILEEDTRTPEELRRSAIHESGHVITGLAIGSTLDLVNINMSGDNGGCARLSIPTGTLVTRDQIEGMVMSLLGGRAAEQLLLGEPSQGAGGSADSDLARCTSMLASLEASLGLGSSLLFRSLPEDAWQLLREPDFRRRVEKLLDELYQRTIDVLHARRPALEAVIEALLEHRFLTGKEVDSIIEKSESVVENRESVALFGVPREPAATG